MSGDQNRDTSGLKPFPKGKSGNPAGRPKGSKSRSTLFREQVENYRAKVARGDKIITPLELFNAIMDDENAKPSERMRAAEAAAPYLHSKLPMRMPMDDPNDTFAKVRAALKAMAQSSNGQPATLAPAAPDAPKAEQK